MQINQPGVTRGLKQASSILGHPGGSWYTTNRDHALALATKNQGKPTRNNETLAKKREETNILHAEFRREELERQLKAEKELNFQERERRQREQKLAVENDKLRAELEMLTTQREDAKRQHEMKLEAMREEEQRVLIEAGTKRFQEDQRKSADQIRLLKERQQRQQDEQQKKLQEVLNKSQTLRQPPIESVGMKSNTAVTKAPIMQSTSVQDENLAIQQRMQDKMEAEMTLRKFRQEALRVEC